MVAVGEVAPQPVDRGRRVALLREVPALATLPAALLEELAAGLAEERYAPGVDFLALLDRARHDEAARGYVRQQLLDAGVARPCALTIEVYRQRALRLLDAAGAREPARGRLRALIQKASWPRQAAPPPG